LLQMASRLLVTPRLLVSLLLLELMELRMLLPLLAMSVLVVQVWTNRHGNGDVTGSEVRTPPLALVEVRAKAGAGVVTRPSTVKGTWA